MTPKSSFAAFSDITGLALGVKVVDVGTCAPNRVPPYAPLLHLAGAAALGFEPQFSALGALNLRKGPNETYVPCVLGDGGLHTFHICRADGMSSLLEPDPSVAGHFGNFSERMTVEARVPVSTVRLDDIPQTLGLDFLKADVGGAELAVFQNGTERLRHASVVHVGVAFLPLYKNQPLFGDIDLTLRAQGFVFHRFDRMQNQAVRPMHIVEGRTAELSQHLQADAIFIKDLTQLGRYTTRQLVATAAILHDCYTSIDVALRLLLEYDRRSATEIATAYLAGLQGRSVPQAA